MPTITLAPGDIATVASESLEEGTPITGDLKPIETVDVRARLEGDLLGVYVREGQHVSAGQLLAQFEASEQQSVQESAVADRASARTDLTTAQWNLEQSAELYKAGAIPERDFKVAQQAVDAARARLAATEAKLRTSTLASRDTRVVAPTNGVIGTRGVEQGERVARGTSMFTIVRNEVLELAAAVPARQANSVRVGQPVHFTADGRTFDGRVARVSPTIDPTSRSITVYVDIPNTDGQLKGGTFATGRVVSRTLPGVLTVPTAAIRQSQDGGHPFAYKLDERIVNVAPLEVGVVDERLGKAEVISGLSLGDRVIVGNVGTLGRGMQAIVIGEERGRGGQDPAPRPRRGGATR
ncbi:MAG TPA: efflux RND transporter periplasmic adaptor subunit [Gemmatimonadaceae bacterium]|nr:efflux RND transporter periplasmic adaptor subunit [Gemmatimonadaceae bacterium]